VYAHSEVLSTVLVEKVLGSQRPVYLPLCRFPRNATATRRPVCVSSVITLHLPSFPLISLRLSQHLLPTLISLTPSWHRVPLWPHIAHSPCSSSACSQPSLTYADSHGQTFFAFIALSPVDPLVFFFLVLFGVFVRSSSDSLFPPNLPLRKPPFEFFRTRFRFQRI